MINEHEHEEERELTGPWRKLHAAVWLIGLAILAWKGWWFPGILVLVAISMLIEALLMQFAPQAFEGGDRATASPSPEAEPATPVVEHRAELLPSTCPKCGGPIRGHEVNWTGPQSADCPYCGVNLPMREAPPPSS